MIMGASNVSHCMFKTKMGFEKEQAAQQMGVAWVFRRTLRQHLHYSQVVRVKGHSLALPRVTPYGSTDNRGEQLFDGDVYT